MKARLYNLFHPGKKSRVLVGAILLLCLLAGSLVACRSAEPMTADAALQALEESITYEEGALSFTIPKEYSPVEDWNIHIAGRAEMDSLGGMSLHNLDGELWEAGKTYTLDIRADITELNMHVFLGEESGTINLLTFAGELSDGIYCALMPYWVTPVDLNCWEFSLMEYDPGTGLRGAVLGAVLLNLADDLTLDGEPVKEPGSEEWRRQVSAYMTWPMLRAEYEPGMTDLLKVEVRKVETL